MRTMGQVLDFRRRQLTKDDLVRMRLPKRYWNASCDQVPNVRDKKSSVGARDMLEAYIRNMEEMRQDGVGLLLWGENGCGKSSIAAIVAKEYRRRFNTVLFIEAANIRTMVIDKDHFDEDETYWQRAMSVDVLVIDDIGKGTTDRTGFGERLMDELIRTRNANKLVTIITTNAVPRGEKETLSDILKPSTIHSLKEHVSVINVRGEDQRDKISGDISNRLAK